MTKTTTLGRYLLNEVMPEGHKVDVALDKGSLTKRLTTLAREDRGKYVDVVGHLKRFGDEISTLEGVSVGLEDITPNYKDRDAIIGGAVAAMRKARTQAEKDAVLMRAQDDLLAHTKAHSGSMTQMALTGARGNIPQLMKIVATPIAAADAKGQPVPFVITKSYAEGLTPGQHWLTGNESRTETITSRLSVSEPGDVAKQFVNLMYPHIISEEDCGTHNGIDVPSSDTSAVGRHLFRDLDGNTRNTVVTVALLAKLRPKHSSIPVRSPMTCESDHGVCKMCQGLDENNRPHGIGVNVGVRAAQALSEPLTQMTLSTKHAARKLKGGGPKMEGLSGVRQLLEVPQSFVHKAALASEHGTVTKVSPAPQGGTYIHVNQVQNYVGPGLAPKVQVGDKVEAGDVLSEGIPKPDEVVRHKGIGVGRNYLVGVLSDTYKSGGISLDRRHLELLVRANIANVKMNDSHGRLLKGEIVPYNQYRKVLAEDTATVPVQTARGRILAKDYGIYSAGTEVTPSVCDALRAQGHLSVVIANDPPHAEFIVKPVTRAPLLDPDWMARLSHRYLKDSVIKGAHFGQTSDIHGTHPVPAYAHGEEFGEGYQGRY